MEPAIAAADRAAVHRFSAVRSRGSSPKLQVFNTALLTSSAAFKPKRSLRVGEDEIPVAEFLSRPIADWLRA